MTRFLDRVIAISAWISTNPWLNGIFGALEGIVGGVMLCALWLMDPAFAIGMGLVAIAILFSVHGRIMAVAAIVSGTLTTVGLVFLFAQ
jgi:hypothetical protein